MSEEGVSLQFSGGGDLPQFIEDINNRLKALESATDSAKAKTSQLDGVVGKLAKSLTAGAVAYKAYAFAAQSVANAMGDIAASAKLEAVIRATGAASGVTSEQMKALNEELRNNSVYSGAAIADAQALMATFDNIGADTFPRAMQAAADMAAVTGSLESATMMLSKALDDPVNGLDALSRSGFKFTDQQKEQIKVMAESGQVMKAQSYVLDAVAKSQGGVAKAIADTPAGQLTKLKNEFADIQAELGAKLIPALVAFQKTMNAVTKFLTEHSEVIAGAVVGAMVVMNAQIIAVTRSVVAMTAAMMSNPLFLAGTAVALAVMGVAMAVKTLNKSMDDASAATNRQKAAMEEAVNRINAFEAAASNASKALKDYNEAVRQSKMTEKEKEQEAYNKAVNATVEGVAEMQKKYEEAFSAIRAKNLPFAKEQAEIEELNKKFISSASETAETMEDGAKAHTQKLNEIWIASNQKHIDAYKSAMEEIALARMTDFDREMALIKKQSEEYEKAVKARGLTAKAAAADMAEIAAWREEQEGKIIKSHADNYAKQVAEELAKYIDAENKKAEAQRKALEDAKKARTAATQLELKEYDALKAESENHYNAEMTKYAEKSVKRVQLQQEAAAKLFAITKEENAARIHAIEAELAEELKAVGLTAGERARLEQAATLQIREIHAQETAEFIRNEDIKTQYAREENEKRKQLALAWGDATLSVINSVASVMANANANKMKDIDAAAEKEKKALESSRMSQRAKAAETARIEEAAAAKRLEVATQQWELEKVMAIVNGAAAVIKTMATVGYPWNIPLAIAQAAAAAAQIAIIQANKPKMAAGGFVPGRSISGDQVEIRANSGEAVLTPAQQRNFMLMANGGGAGRGGDVNIGDTNIVINGSADSSTVDAISRTLADHRQGIIELLYEAERRGEIDHSRLAWA